MADIMCCAVPLCRPGTKVVFTLNGETGKSVSQYAGQWLKLVGSTKNIIRGQKPLRKSDVLVSSSSSGSNSNSSSSSACDS
jgi:hypothetical protein